MSVHGMLRDYFDWAKAYPPSSDARLTELTHNTRRMFSCLDPTGFGLTVYVNKDWDQVVALPGHQPVLVADGHVVVLNLDLAFDIDDPALRGLRAILVGVLAERSIDFLPVSLNALRGGLNINTVTGLTLVARDGMQCVFTVGEVPYISGFDANEDPPLYFLARLPAPRFDTYAEALEALKPGSVKQAEAEGLRVLRQGDMFAIPTDYTTDGLKALGAKFGMEVTRELPAGPFVSWNDAGTWFPGVSRWTILEHDQRIEPAPTMTFRRGLYGTAHTATELAYLPDGTMFARGTVVHDPRGVLGQARTPDHQPMVLPPRQWFLMVRNTVPIREGG